MKVNVVFTDPFWAVEPGLGPKERLASIERQILGPDANLILGAWTGSGFDTHFKALRNLVECAHAVVVGKADFGPEIITALPDTCRVIAHQGNGYDRISIPDLASRGIFSFNIPDYCTGEVAAHTLAFILAHERGLLGQDRMIKDGLWDPFAGRSPRRLEQLTLGLVGFGRIGRAVADRAQRLFKNIFAYDPYVSPEFIESSSVIAVSDVQQLFSQSDYVSLNASLTDTSRRMINGEVLSASRRDQVLVNTSRSGLVDEIAILEALDAGRIDAYLSDVFDSEPMHHRSTSDLSRHTRVLASCHRAFYSDASVRSLRARTVTVLDECLRTGAPPTYGRLT
jgi:phosphoglycerate dehydrogenase-like enzyme